MELDSARQFCVTFMIEMPWTPVLDSKKLINVFLSVAKNTRQVTEINQIAIEIVAAMNP